MSQKMLTSIYKASIKNSEVLSSINSGERSVLNSIAFFSEDNGSTKEGIPAKQLCVFSAMSMSSVRRAIKTLHDANIISSTIPEGKHGNVPPIYHIHLEALESPSLGEQI